MEPRAVRLVVVCGLPGVGKTTVAERVARGLDARLLRTDVVRNERFAAPAYTDAETRTVYDALLDRARRSLAAGRSVVLDGTFRDAGDRRRARAVAQDADAGFTIVLVECDESVVASRIASRSGDESDADFAVHTRLREEFDPVELDHVTVRNSGALERTRRRIDRLVVAGQPPGAAAPSGTD